MSKKSKSKFKHGWKYYAKKSKKYLESYCMVGTTEKELKKRKKFRERWGFGYEDAWSLDEYAAALLLPRFAYLRDYHHGFPTALGSIDEKTGQITDTEAADKKWSEILDCITRGLYLYISKEDFDWTRKDKQLWKATMNYIKEYYVSFWD